MKRVGWISGLTALALAMLGAGSPAAAQAVQGQTVSACGTPNNTPVVKGFNWLTMDTTGVLCTSGSGGGGGSASFTAAAAPYSVAAGTNKPAGISTINSAQWSIPVKPGTTTEIDLSLPSAILGTDGATIVTAANPFDVRPTAQALSVKLGSVGLYDSAGTTAATIKAASTAPATTDTAIVIAPSPTPTLPCNSKVAVSVTASTDLVTFSNTGYICSIVLVGASAETWGLVDGTGSVCATGIAGILGGTTGTMSFAANGGFSAVNDRPWVSTSGSAKHLCLIKSGAGNISGVITYRDF